MKAATHSNLSYPFFNCTINTCFHSSILYSMNQLKITEVNITVFSSAGAFTTYIYSTHGRRYLVKNSEVFKIRRQRYRSDNYYILSPRCLSVAT